MRQVLAITVVVYVVLMFSISLWARTRIKSEEDYLVAGRRLPLSLAWPTLFATWFGAGTLLTAAEEVRAHGLRAAALDPLGAGVCLILAGLFFAGPLWRMNLLTLADFYQRRFGSRAETVAALIMVPTFLGWISAQFVALAGVLELFFGLDPTVGIALVAVVGAGYTLIGGMWSVTLTDAMQVAFVIVGLVALTVDVTLQLGHGDMAAGVQEVFAAAPAEKLVVVPRERLGELLPWLAAFSAGALGNLPGQDLTQRMFASRTAATARNACLVAGGVYLVVGALPVFLALSVDALGAAPGGSILPALAETHLHPVVAVLFVVAVMSAVLSTIDSAILAPSGVLAQNLLHRVLPYPVLRLNQLAVAGVAGVSLALAYAGESAYALLESAYELGLAGLLVPLAVGLYSRRGGERAALASMLFGTAVWTLHLLLGWETLAPPWLGQVGLHIPIGLASAGLGLLAYFGVAAVEAAPAALSAPAE